MLIKDVKEVVHEALNMYIDDMSVISEVKAYKDMETDSASLVIYLKTGDVYRLSIKPIALSMNTREWCGEHEYDV
jgi:hypothetical protein